MTILTANGSFAQAYRAQFEAEVVSFRELGEGDFVERLCQAETIIHNAATIESDDLGTYLKRNFDFTRYLIGLLEEFNPNAHLIFLSSMSILDPGNDQAYGDVLQMSSYAYSKYLAETLCLKSKLNHISCVRFSTLFYGDPKKDGLSKLVHDAVMAREIRTYNHGEAKRNFLPIKVAAQYVQKIAGQTDVGKRNYNLADDHSTSFAEVAQILHKLLPDLTIHDHQIDSSSPVLANFTTRDISAVGQIRFSLENEILAYIGRLQK